MPNSIPQYIRDWCETNGYEKISLVEGLLGKEYWAIAPGSYMPERLPIHPAHHGLSFSISVDTRPFHEAVRSFQAATQSERMREAMQQVQSSAEGITRIFRGNAEQVYGYLVQKSAALVEQHEDECDRSYIERQFALNQKQPRQSLPKALINIRIQEFCQAHRVAEKQLAAMLNAGTVKVRLGILQPAKGFKPAKAPSAL